MLELGYSIDSDDTIQWNMIQPLMIKLEIGNLKTYG